MATKVGAIIAVLFCTLITAFAQIFYKWGSDGLSFSVEGVLLNKSLLLGLALYAVGALILVVALKYGELSVLYPIIALGYVWVNILSAYFFGEELSTMKWIGIAMIMGGMACIGYGSKASFRKKGVSA